MKVTEVDCQMAKEMEVRFEVMALDELEEQEQEAMGVNRHQDPVSLLLPEPMELREIQVEQRRQVFLVSVVEEEEEVEAS